MLGRETRVQATFGRPGYYDNALLIGFVRVRDRSRLSREAAAPSVVSRSLRKIAVAIFVSLGLLTAASASPDDVEGCANASDLKGALAACTKIIESNWANDHQVALAFNNRANANDALGYSNAAINDYSRALAIDPHYGNALYNRGSTYLELGKLDLAIASRIRRHGQSARRRLWLVVADLVATRSKAHQSMGRRSLPHNGWRHADTGARYVRAFLSHRLRRLGCELRGRLCGGDQLAHRATSL